MSTDHSPACPVHKVGLYNVGRKLGNGSFGEVYSVSSDTGEEFACKIESSKCKHPQILYEANLIKYLQGVPGIVNVYWFGEQGDYNAMVIDRLGPSLEELFNICNRKFSLKTVLLLANQMLYRVEYLHSKNFIHRDIKPENFLIGHKKQKNVVYLIDFGLAKKYRDPKAKQHIPFCENKTLTGTARYASINAHQGMEQSRRDDLEAIGYVLMYFNRGRLPWQAVTANAKGERYREIMEIKMSTPIEVLCHGYPPVFASYLNYCRTLRFNDSPDYAYLRRVFKGLFTRQGFTHDFQFDWSQSPMPTSVPRESMDHEEKVCSNLSPFTSAAPSTKQFTSWEKRWRKDIAEISPVSSSPSNTKQMKSSDRRWRKDSAEKTDDSGDARRVRERESGSPPNAAKHRSNLFSLTAFCGRKSTGE